jgi:hypothetical protein
MGAEPGPIGLTGGCQCGAVRYRLDGPPTRSTLCHCRMCQKAGGSPFMAFAAVARENMVMTRGEISTFASSSYAERGFCAACGTPLTYRVPAGASVSVTICSLDDPNAVSPGSQLGVESRVPWLDHALALPALTTDEWMARFHPAAGAAKPPDQKN